MIMSEATQGGEIERPAGLCFFLIEPARGKATGLRSGAARFVLLLLTGTFAGIEGDVRRQLLDLSVVWLVFKALNHSLHPVPNYVRASADGLILQFAPFSMNTSAKTLSNGRLLW
jgi:hypothetical protein